MGRFYNTADSQYLDWAFTPNLEVAGALAEQEVKESYMRAKLLDAAPDIEIDHWGDAHGEAVAKKKEYYEGLINNFTEQMSGSQDMAATMRKVMPEIKKVRRELKDDFTKGDLFKIQETAKNHRRFTEDLNKLVDPSDREFYKQLYEQGYLDGDRKDLFDYNTMYDTKDITSMFLKSDEFKNLHAMKNGRLVQNNRGAWIVEDGKNTVELSSEQIQKAFDIFQESTPGLREYAQERTTTGREDNWFDETGAFDTSENGYLGRLRKNISDTYSYKDVQTSKKMTVNKWAMRAADIAQRRKEAKAEKASVVPRLNGDWFVNNTYEGIKLQEKYTEARESLIISSISNPDVRNNYVNADEKGKQDILRAQAELISRPVDGRISNAGLKLQELDQAYADKKDLGLHNYQDLFNDDDLGRLEKVMTSPLLEASMRLEKGYFEFPEQKRSLGAKKGNKMSPSDMENRLWNVPGSPYEGFRISKLTPIPKTFVPSSHKIDERTKQITGGAMYYNVVLEGEEDGDGNFPTATETIIFYAPNKVIDYSIK